MNNVLSKKYDIILVCDYFFHNKDLYESIIKIKNKNSKIIHDVTHTFLSNNTTFSNDDYIVCSLRKWFLTTDGGIVIKNSKNNLFSIKNKKEHNKTKSREYKNLYYKDNTDNIKRKYIEYSKLAEQCLNDDFALYGISSETGEKLLNTNFDTEIKKRQKYYNLIKEKIDLSAIAYCLNGISKDNCLFTLPIIINENRNKILTLFYNNLIRCSILWEPTEKNKNVDTNFINKSICLDMTEDTDKKIEKILKKL